MKNILLAIALVSLLSSCSKEEILSGNCGRVTKKEIRLNTDGSPSYLLKVTFSDDDYLWVKSETKEEWFRTQLGSQKCF